MKPIKDEWLQSIENRLAALEKDSHPPKDLQEFEQWNALDDRIKNIEDRVFSNNESTINKNDDI